MFEKRRDLVRFLAVAEAGGFAMAAKRMSITQPALTRVIARLEEQFGGRLFDRLPGGVRLTALGGTVAELTRGILREIEMAEERIGAARSGRTGRLRVTAGPVWIETVLPEAIARLHEVYPALEIRLESATRARGIRLLADGKTDLHCGGIDSGETLPAFLRRDSFLDTTAGVVAHLDHPLHSEEITGERLAAFPWIDYDAPATSTPGERRSSLSDVLDGLDESTRMRVRTVIRTGSAGLSLMARGPYLARISLSLLERFPATQLRPLPVKLGRIRYRSGSVARRASEDLPPFRRFEALLREATLGRLGGES